MAYRLGVDVGGTFTDLFLVDDSDGGAQFRVKTPSTPADPSQGVLTGVRRICDEAGIGVADVRNILHGTTVATNAVLESKGARVGLITTQGFAQILHLARSQTPGAARRLDHHDQARSPRIARRHARGGRADGAPRRDDRPRRRGAGRTDRPRPHRDRRRVAHDRADQLLRQSRARGADRSRRGAALPRLPGHALRARAARVPRVRADADGVHELVRQTQGRDVHHRSAARARRDRRHRRGQHPPLGRRADDHHRGRPEPDLRDPLRAVRWRRRRALRRPQGGVRRHPDLRHGRHVDRRRAVPERRADDRARDVDRPLPHQGAVGQRPHRRSRRRLDRPRAGADEGAARRPAVRRRGPRPRGLRSRRHGADRDGCERRARPSASAAAGRRDGHSTSTRHAPPCRRSRTPWACRPSRRPPRGSSRS